MKNSLAVIFGGRTAEHDISVITAHQLMDNVGKAKYDIHPVYISHEGVWFTGDALRDIKVYKNFDPKRKDIYPAHIPPVPGGGLQIGGGLFKAQKHIPLDAAVIAMHGMHGEDGTVQGLLELADLPYTSASVLGSSVGMDKIMMKAAFIAANAPVLPDIHFLRSEWERDSSALIARVEAELGYPVFVKPANLGSSIGIGRADSRESLVAAVEVAAKYDRRILVEKGVNNALEYNCACLGYGDEALVSEVERPVSWQEFLSFDEKYLRGAKQTGMKSLERELPANISAELKEKIQSATRLLFKELDCKGVVRIDYLFDPTGDKLFVNEINTIPGSFAFYLFEPIGLAFPELVDKLVEYALIAHEDKSRSSFAYDSMVLSKAAIAGQKAGIKS